MADEQELKKYPVINYSDSSNDKLQITSDEDGTLYSRRVIDGVKSDWQSPGNDLIRIKDYLDPIIDHKTDKYLGTNLYLPFRDRSGTYTIDQCIKDLKDSNINTLAIAVRFWCINAESRISSYHTSSLVTNDYVKDIARKAKEAGMRVIFKPHVTGNGFTSFNSINPVDPEAFLDSYADFYMTALSSFHEYIDIACVTNEMDNQTKLYKDKWTNLINRIRTLDSRILISNSSTRRDILANVFLDQLDILGMNIYLNIGGDLTTNPSDQVRNMFTNTDNAVNNAFRISTKLGKPIMFTEVGCQPYVSALASPESSSHTGDMNYEYQSRYYNVVLKNLIESSAVGTLIWHAQSDVVSDGSFAFLGNPSQSTVAKIYGEVE